MEGYITKGKEQEVYRSLNENGIYNTLPKLLSKTLSDEVLSSLDNPLILFYKNKNVVLNSKCGTASCNGCGGGHCHGCRSPTLVDKVIDSINEK